MRSCGGIGNNVGRAMLAACLILAATSGFGRGQVPSSSGSSSGVLDPYGWTPTPIKLPTVNTPDVKTQDYFGPSTNQPFSEKTLFPNPAIPDPPKTQAPVGLGDIPPPDPTIMIPDGSWPDLPPKKNWKGGVEFGLNGSQGNTDVLSLRFAANADRKVDNNLFHVDILYTLTNQSGLTKQNQAFLNARDEILFKGSPWSLFSAVQVEYDEFRAYDLRAGGYTGLSYLWLKNSTTLFKTRVGVGVVRELDTESGGPPAKWIPEAVLGDDFNYRFTERQGIVSGFDIYPNLSQLGEFRVRARAGYEIVVDPTHGMVLRLGIQERYDSNPGPAKRNDFNYFTTMLFKF